MKRAELRNQARLRIRERIEHVVGAAGDLPRFDEALTHPSHANESGRSSNQRLEFLGDAVLGLCVSEILSRDNPDADEGVLTRMRSALVNASALAAWAREHQLGAAIALGKGASAGSEREQTNVLADAVEALVACVYDAHGIRGALALVADIVESRTRGTSELAKRDPKSELQERVQALGFETPRYRLASAVGPDHNATFTIEVCVGDIVLGAGTGRSKKDAERDAAQAALAVDYEDALANAPSDDAPNGPA